jgi:hypothetical protein
VVIAGPPSVYRVHWAPVAIIVDQLDRGSIRGSKNGPTLFRSIRYGSMSLTIARATCDTLAEGMFRYSIFSSELGTRCLTGLMVMNASASNQMETESEFLTHDS